MKYTFQPFTLEFFLLINNFDTQHTPIWSANSLPGTIIKAKGLLNWLFNFTFSLYAKTCWIIGVKYANVLPQPVSAAKRVLFPPSIAGIPSA